MPTGAFDPTTGVWIYGEDDLLSPWSAYMNLGMNSVKSAVAPLQTATADTGSLADGANPDPIVSWGSGWTSYTGAPWTAGVRVRRWGPLVIVTGAIQKATAWAASETILTLAVGFRPDVQIDNRTFAVQVDGQLKMDNAGGPGAAPLNIIFFRA